MRQACGWRLPGPAERTEHSLVKEGQVTERLGHFKSPPAEVEEGLESLKGFNLESDAVRAVS